MYRTQSSAVTLLVLAAVLLPAARAVGQQTLDPERVRFALNLQGDGRVVTSHVTTIRGQRIGYDATVGTLTLPDSTGRPAAAIGYIEYAKRNVADRSRWPVMFVWNGGPGASSSILHLHVIGPRRYVKDATGAVVQPVAFQDNDKSPLDRTDLVFVDPIGTGFSVPLGSATMRDFFGLERDAISITDFIIQYLEETGRSGPPVVLMGESYGTQRAAVVAGMLAERGMPPSGVVFISAAINGHSLWESSPHLPPYIFRIPAYAAIAYYHDKLAERPPALEPFLHEVEEFALQEFTPALFAWHRISPEQKAQVLEKLERYTAVPAETWERHDLQYSYRTYAEEFLRDRGLVLNVSDARATRPAPTAEAGARGGGGAASGSSAEAEPRESPMERYLRDELGVSGAPPYAISVATGGWDYSYRPGPMGVPAYPYYIYDLMEAMEANPAMQVALYSGIYDLTTNYFAAEWSMRRMQVPPELTANLHIVHFEGGHMMYNAPDEFGPFTDDVDAFLARVIEPGAAEPVVPRGGAQQPAAQRDVRWNPPANGWQCCRRLTSIRR